MRIDLFKNFCLIVSAILMAVSCSGDRGRTVGIVPEPVSINVRSGSFEFVPETVISVENEDQAAVAGYFTGLLSASAGFAPAVETGAADAQVRLVTDTTIPTEGYRLSVRKDGIEIEASDLRGFFYAFQTLRLSLPAAIDGGVSVAERWKIPAMEVSDAPRYGYRGVMLDVSRHFIPKEDVMKIIDCMAMLKFNTLHWHLTDDNGWRVEIKKYPRLTSVGAWRVDRGETPFSSRRNQQPGEKATSGGFYTQEEIREVVAYAAERQIEIIPEIDMPAHSSAALAAYPEFTCPVVKKPVTVLPGLGGGRWDVIWCAGNDKAYSFIEDVLDEVIGLFPSQYIHIGGDEAQKTNWKKCPLCQKRIRDEKLGDEEHLQGYFMGRVADYLRTKGKTVIGWDELVKSKLPEDAVICGWQGTGKAAFTAADQGHRFIMAPARVMYFIRYQGPQWFEPLTYFGNITLKDVYDYEPAVYHKEWKPEYEPLMMGLQGCMWTEFCYDTDDVTYLLFPRLAALSEISWSPYVKRDWDGFLPRLDSFLAHLDAKGVVYAKSMYNIQHTVSPSSMASADDGEETAGNTLEVTLDCIRPDVTIRYTLDGTDPVPSSAKYAAPLVLGDDVSEVRCATFFKDGTQAGQTLVLPLVWDKATAGTVTGQPASLHTLTNGVRGSLRESDFEWCTWTPGKDTEFVVDLGEVRNFDKVVLGCLTNYGMAVHKPASIKVEVSGDGETYSPAGERSFTRAQIFTEGNFVEDIEFGMPGTEARYVRVSATAAGPCPADHVRPGQDSKYCFDELMIE